MSIRKLSALDSSLSELGRALTTALGPAASALRAYPATDTAQAPLNAEARQHAAGLMRINHAGEVCAQALYVGQAAVARDAATRSQLLEAAQEESDHLAWCAERLAELNSQPSLLNPVWYLGSFAIGAAAGLAGDRWSLGFVIETERQVEAHLGEHLETLPAADQRSRAIVRVMQGDEARHGANAMRAGGAELPAPVPTLMRFAAGVMKLLAYRV